MHVSALLPLLLFSTLISAHNARPPHRRRLVRNMAERDVDKLVIRAGAPFSNATLEASSAADPSSSALSSTTSSIAVSSAVSSASSTDSQAVISTTDAQSQVSSAVSTSSSNVEQSSVATSSPVTSSSAVASSVSSAVVSSVVQSSVNTAPLTLSVASSASSAPTAVVIVSSAHTSVVTATKTASTSSTASSAADSSSSKKSSGLSKTTIIVIAVVASVVGLAVIAWTLFRKWKLRPSNRFDERMKPIDFSPHDGGMNDDFLEKTLHRTASNASADRQRQQFVKELEAENGPDHVSDIPEHDFTAGTNHAGYGAYDNNDMYHNDPFAHAQAYEYDQSAYYQQQHEHVYPPAAAHPHHEEYPTQDQPEEGYADLQRGNSLGSGHGHEHRQVYPTDFPMPDTYLGRPTGGAEGPYAQAAQYRY